MKQPYLFLPLFLFTFNVLQAQQPASGWKAKLDSATVYQKAERYADAVRVLEEAKGMMEKVGAVQDETYIGSLNSLGEIKVNQGDYKGSEELFSQALALQKTLFGDQNRLYLSIYDNLATLYVYQRKVDKAFEIFNTILPIEEQVLGKEDMLYLTTAGNLAYCYYLKERYKEARERYLYLLPLEIKALGKKSYTYMNDLQNLARICFTLGQYDETNAYLSESLSVCDSLYGKTHSQYGFILNKLGVFQYQIGNYELGIKYTEQALAIQEKTWGRTTVDYASSIGSLGGLYLRVEDFSKAKVCISESLELFSKLLGNQHPKYLYALGQLSNLYYQTGNYTQALTTAEQARDITAKAVGVNSKDYIQTLVRLLPILIAQGKYQEAESLYFKTLAIYNAVLNVKDADYLILNEWYITLLSELGDITGYTSYSLKNVEYSKANFGDNTRRYAEALNTVANSYIRLGKRKDAMTLLNESKKILEQTRMTQSSPYAVALINTANNLVVENRFEKADSLYHIALTIYQTALGTNHPLYAKTLSLMAELYQKQHQFEKAVSFSRQSLKPFSPLSDIISTKTKLATLYLTTDQLDSARHYLYQTIPAQMNQIRQTFTFTSERQQTEFLNAQRTNIELPFSLLQKSNDTTLSGLACNLSLLVKGLSLQTGTQLRKTAESSEDTLTLALLLQLNTLKTSLNAQYQKLPEKRFRVVELEQEAEAAEKKLMTQSAAFRTAINGLNANWKSIQAALKPNEAAIEWVHYRYYNKDWTDTVYYAAFIIRPNSVTPQFVLTCSEKSLLELLTFAPKTKPLTAVNQLYRKNSPLYSLLWQPLEHYLQGCQTLYVSPSGILYRLAFSAIVSPNGTPLTNRYDLHILSHLRSLPAKNTPIPFPNSAALFGGIDYENVLTVKAPAETKAGLNSRFLTTYQTRERSGAGNWPYLPATSKEVNELRKLLSINKAKVLKYEGAQASEENFKALDGRHTALLHVATHGFAYPKDTAATDRTTLTLLTNPLLRTGLALAGAKRYKTDTSANNREKEDGILTAYETAQLNLSGTELAVLSACESGLGDIQGTEGVYGLQRGFKLAGVKHLLMSLWKVNDEAANEWMRSFYSQWQKTGNLSKAYQQTQRQMQTKYPRPDVWAAFVLVE